MEFRNQAGLPDPFIRAGGSGVLSKEEWPNQAHRLLGQPDAEETFIPNLKSMDNKNM